MNHNSRVLESDWINAGRIVNLKSEVPQIGDRLISNGVRGTDTISVPVRVLQDHSASFPVTRFDDGVDLLFNYGNLNDYRIAKLGAFDYIVLNTNSYIGLGQVAEESLRKALRENGRYADGVYRKLYEGNDTVLYKFVKLEAPPEKSPAGPLVTQAARNTTVK